MVLTLGKWMRSHDGTREVGSLCAQCSRRESRTSRPDPPTRAWAIDCWRPKAFSCADSKVTNFRAD
jgi:hypothetical protein